MSLILKTIHGVKDVSRFNHTLTPTGDAIVGHHIELPGGGGDFIGFPNIGITNGATGTGEFSFLVWYKLDAIISVSQTLIDMLDEFYWKIYPYSTNIRMVAYDGGVLREAVAPGVLAGVWQCAGGTYSSVDGMKSYLNGEPGGVNAWTGTASAQSYGTNGIGARGDGALSFAGLIGETRIYDHVLTAGDYKEDYLKNRIYY